MKVIDAVEFGWRALALEAFPTILGFSLAAYAITFSLMGSALHRSLSATMDKRTGIPLIDIVNATFFHVVLVQISVLVFAIMSEGTLAHKILNLTALAENDISATLEAGQYAGDLFGFFLTVYAVSLLLSVALAMYRLGRMAPKHENTSRASSASNDDEKPSGVVPENPTLQSRRFKFIVWLSKKLRIYD
ncbi:MAG: hypothetical protein JJ901_13185 [Erythrobacter sp.]|nr:hypothetical protein [Erythrobacter sp.]